MTSMCSMRELADASEGLRNAKLTVGATIDDPEACHRIMTALSGLLTGCVYDRDVTGGFVMSEAVEVGGFCYCVEYYIDDSEEELVAEEAIDWEEHVWRIAISPVEVE